VPGTLWARGLSLQAFEPPASPQIIWSFRSVPAVAGAPSPRIPALSPAACSCHAKRKKRPLLAIQEIIILRSGKVRKYLAKTIKIDSFYVI
jgi:hypothetical protein